MRAMGLSKCYVLFVETRLNDPQYFPYIPYGPYGKRHMYFGHTAGNVGQQGINSGNVAVGHQWNHGKY